MQLLKNILSSWALFGGVIILGVIAVNTYSIIASALINKPFPGDFELTEMGVAIGIFCFLPYAQLTRAHVVVDIFTFNASYKQVRFMRIIANATAIIIASILLWRMSYGLQDYIIYQEVTAILNIPIWWAFVPIIISLFLFVMASIASFIQVFIQVGDNE